MGDILNELKARKNCKKNGYQPVVNGLGPMVGYLVPESSIPGLEGAPTRIKEDAED